MANSVTDNSGAVTDNPGKMRYEIHEGAEVAGFISYGREGKVIILLHTETDPRFRGGGLAGCLVRAGLDDARKRGSPCCPSARSSGTGSRATASTPIWSRAAPRRVRPVTTAAPGGRRQHPAQERPGVRTRDPDDVLGRALGDHPTAARAALGSHVDDPVRGLDDIQVVLDDDHGVALVDQRVQHAEQLGDVLEVQAGRGLVEDVDRPAGRALLQFGGELDPLRLAAGQRGAGCPSRT